MNEKENKHQPAEQEFSPENRLGVITSRAKGILDEYNIKPTIEDDGSIVRHLTTSEFLELKETSSSQEDEPKIYELSLIYVHRPMDIQIRQWEEKSNEVVSGVKPITCPEEPMQRCKTLQMDKDLQSSLELYLTGTEMAYREDLYEKEKDLEKYDIGSLNPFSYIDIAIDALRLKIRNRFSRKK